MTVRNAPILRLVPDTYSDLLPFFEALRQVITEQGEVVTDAADALVSDPPAGGAGQAAGAYDTADNRDLMIASLTTLITDVAVIRTQLNALLAELRTEGTIKT